MPKLCGSDAETICELVFADNLPFYDIHHLQGDPIRSEDFPECFSMETVERLFKIYEVGVNGAVLFS